MFRSLVFGLLLSTGGAVAQAADFQHYILALTWHPAFCESADARPECRRVSRDDFAATEFVLHGLWPNGGRDDDYCDVSARDERHSRQRNWCAIDDLGLPDNLRTQLRTLMPGSHPRSCLQRHEWAKHGSCTDLNPTDYYQLSADLVRAFAKTQFSDYIRDNIGQRVRRNQVYDVWKKEFGRNAGWKMQLICRSGLLTEVRVWLDPTTDGTVPLRQLITKDRVDARARCPRQFVIDGL